MPTKTANSTSNQVVFRFPKNTNEEVRATLSTYRGHDVADIRVYVSGDLERPTKKGLTLQIDQLPRLQEAVTALLAALKDTGEKK